ncbi:PRC-barrel domain-containing protein [Neotabrizicola sp. sgz301269]|uniref:PRC-barrel domain-containing protein n=1 Tax=Neotabrizicola sp. sgz301269 TaxID=3276282 RepID=UPI0037701922
MKKLIVSTALSSVLALSALPVLAQTAADPAASAPEATAPADTATTAASPYLPGVQDGVRASDFIGKRVYVTEADTSGLSDTAIAQANADWEDAGEISDLIISMSGDTEAVLVDFGGFLGIGEKTVALSLNDLTMVPDSNSPDDYFIVFHGSKAELEAAPTFDPEMVFSAAEPAAPAEGTVTADTDPASPETAVVPDMTADPAATAATETEAAPAGEMAAGEAVDLAAWAEADLIGKRVYGPGDEDVGEISSVSLDANGKVAAAVVDVGGFLGMGEKPVALDSSMLTLVKEADGDVFFRVAATQEQLEQMQPYAG